MVPKEHNLQNLLSKAHRLRTAINCFGGLTNVNEESLNSIFLNIYLHDSPQRRYKIFWIQVFWQKPEDSDGVYAGHSPDGIHFTTAGRVLPLIIDNPLLAFWDERINKYVIYARALAPNTQNQRRIARIETSDILAPWPYNVDASPYNLQRPNLRLITP